MTKIKICGLKRMEDIHMINKYNPDYIGFVFAGNKRKITYEQASEFKKALNPGIKSVGVFINEPIEGVSFLCKNDIIDFVQLHGDEDENYISSLKEVIDKPIIKAVRVKSKDDITEADKLDVDYLLFDTFAKDAYGGTGKTFDHSLIPEKINKPFFLAGGISALNVKEILGQVDAWAVDVSSSVETDGFKDEEKVKEIIRLVRN